MKPKAKRLSKAKQLPLDRISTLPSSIIENILCLVPIKEAARTSILSKDWKYNWTKIPKLVFDEDAFEVILTHENEDEDEDELNDRKKMTKTCRTFYAIYQVLLMHQGPILEFTLSMKANNTCVEMDQILYHLSRNTNNVKKLTLDMREYDGYCLPLSLFSLHKLTHLDLRKCSLVNLAFRPTITGFVNLTNLRLDDVDTTANTIRRLISKAPLLKSFSLIMDDYELVRGCYSNSNDSTIYDLFEPLLMIEHMTISVWAIRAYTVDTVPRELPTSLVHLKYFSLEGGSFFSDEYALPFLVLMMRSSPKMEKLKLQMCNRFAKWYDPVTRIEYSDIWLEHLTEFEVKDYCNINPELELVKLILVKSPTLKKVSIRPDIFVAVSEEVQILRDLLRAPRASPMVDIIVKRLR